MGFDVSAIGVQCLTARARTGALVVCLWAFDSPPREKWALGRARVSHAEFKHFCPREQTPSLQQRPIRIKCRLVDTWRMECTSARSNEDGDVVLVVTAFVVDVKEGIQTHGHQMEAFTFRPADWKTTETSSPFLPCLFLYNYFPCFLVPGVSRLIVVLRWTWIYKISDCFGHLNNFTLT